MDDRPMNANPIFPIALVSTFFWAVSPYARAGFYVAIARVLDRVINESQIILQR
jgi:hypothetical protein